MRRSRRRSCRVCTSELHIPPRVWRRLREQNEGRHGSNEREIGVLLRIDQTGPGRYVASISRSSSGDGGSVVVPRESYGTVSAHGHHPGGYRSHGVMRAWPSFDDFVQIHDRALDRRQNCLLHLVLTLEGIYTVSLSPRAIRRGRKWLTRMGDRLDMYHRELPKTGGYADSHMEYVRDVQGGPFDVHHLPWPVGELSPLRIPFSHPSCDGGSCVITGCSDSDM